MSWDDPERFEVVGLKSGPHDPTTDYFEAVPTSTSEISVPINVVVLHYETHFDARVGADGLRAIGYTIAGIKDREGDVMVDCSRLTARDLKGAHRG